uniref:Uncharacterized protein n=1 Tax=Arundo donax TaxID=35708 RepID=A0A0A9A2T7_ARUDO
MVKRCTVGPQGYESKELKDVNRVPVETVADNAPAAMLQQVGRNLLPWVLIVAPSE